MRDAYRETRDAVRSRGQFGGLTWTSRQKRENQSFFLIVPSGLQLIVIFRRLPDGTIALQRSLRLARCRGAVTSLFRQENGFQ